MSIVQDLIDGKNLLYPVPDQMSRERAIRNMAGWWPEQEWNLQHENRITLIGGGTVFFIITDMQGDRSIGGQTFDRVIGPTPPTEFMLTRIRPSLNRNKSNA